MSRYSAIKCDGPGCTKIKGEANKWLVVFQCEFAFSIYLWDEGEMNAQDRMSKGWKIKHICSSECLNRIEQDFLLTRVK